MSTLAGSGGAKVERAQRRTPNAPSQEHMHAQLLSRVSWLGATSTLSRLHQHTLLSMTKDLPMGMCIVNLTIVLLSLKAWTQFQIHLSLILRDPLNLTNYS